MSGETGANKLSMGSVVQGFVNPHGFAGKGSRGKGRGQGFKTLTKPLPAVFWVDQCISQPSILILSHIRNHLTVASTCTLMCLSAWTKLNLVQNSDIKAAVVLPDIIGDEDELELGWDHISYD